MAVFEPIGTIPVLHGPTYSITLTPIFLFVERESFVLLCYSPSIFSSRLQRFRRPFPNIRHNNTQNPTIHNKESQAGKP